jgi:hypothetical protein
MKTKLMLMEASKCAMKVTNEFILGLVFIQYNILHKQKTKKVRIPIFTLRDPATTNTDLIARRPQS